MLWQRGDPPPLSVDTLPSKAVGILCSVIFLRAALGPAAVAQPAINLNTAFEMAANAALGTTLKPGFMPYRVIAALATPHSCHHLLRSQRTR